MPTNEKGIFFSVDALLAALLLSIFASSLAFMASQSAQDDTGKLMLKKQSADLLLAMDKSGLLAEMDSNRTAGALASALPSGTGYSFGVEYYNYSGRGGAFTRVQSGNASRGNASTAQETDSSQRGFVVPRQGQPPLYGIATLALWKG